MGRGTIALVVLGTLILAVASRFRDVSLCFWVGMVLGAVVWELTKFRLRRHACRYASSGNS